ncbi:MAG: 3-keto-5-aminohexanoate cleavage protein [Myxococcota bacterium]
MPVLGDKVIIEVGLNENQSRRLNRHVPCTPREIAEAARLCCDAGAAIVHYHGRTAEGTPALSDPAINLEIQRRITESSAVIAYPSYGSEVHVLDHYDIGTPAPERWLHLREGVAARVGFEVAPVDLGVFDTNAGWDPVEQQLVPSTGALLNTGTDQRWMLEFCREHGLKPHFTVFDTVHVQNLANLVHWKWIGDPPVVVKLFLVGANVSPKLLLFYEDRLREALPTLEPIWLPLVYGADQFPLCTFSLIRGGHVRVGIGDHPYRERGEPSNARLVEEIVTVARALGREPASAHEVRRVMGLEPRGAL